MSNVQFPEKITGEWIYLERLKKLPDESVLLRHSFFVSGDLSDDFLLMVSANTSYQLFVNGRLAGVGPRVHQSPGTSYIDAHEIGVYLESGNNLIAFFLHNNPDRERGDLSRTPGLWCQLQCGGKTLLQSDDTWQIMALEEFNRPRPRVAGNGRLTAFADLRALPSCWNSKEDSSGKWEQPDMLVLPGTPGALIELHPVPPAIVGAEPFEFAPVARGFVSEAPGFSSCVFPRCFPGDTAVAVSYVFCEEEKSLKVRMYTDDPCRFFCNRKKIFEGNSAQGEELEIHFSKGFNRLLLFAKPEFNSMGVMFTARQWPQELTFLSDMMDSAEPGWCRGRISRLKYEECTPAVSPEVLSDLSLYISSNDSITDIWDWLADSKIEKAPRNTDELSEGDLQLFKLPVMRYGCVRFSLTAHAGDIVDFIIGSEPERDKLFPRSNDRELISCICREGQNEISNLIPSDCHSVMIYVRKAQKKITVESAVLDELSRNFNRECAFSCSDHFFNRVWQTGRESLSRSCVALVPSDGCAKHDSFLLDSFLESANVAAVFGDSGYIAARLRQFAEVQLENGAVPSLASGRGYEPALNHMFFFSGWLLYNYRFSGNMVELRSMLPNLDAAKKYLVSLLQEERFLIDTASVGPYRGNETDPVVCCRLPVVLNALFCRFMISASEIYDLVERPFDARECRRFVRKVSDELVDNFFDKEAGLFTNNLLEESMEEMEFSLLGNFFPLLAGIKTAECFEKFVNTFFDFGSAAPLTIEAESPYFHYLFTEMLFALGQKGWAIRYLERYWNMRMDHDNKLLHDPFSGMVKSSTLINGNSVVPNVFLIREIVGVRIADPAHALIYFDPAWEQVDQAEAAIPTARGRIHITWKKQPDGGLEVNIYASHPLGVLPELSEEMLKKSTFRLSENVMLVKSALRNEDDDEEEEA